VPVFLCVASSYAQETFVPQEIFTPKDVVTPEESVPTSPVDITPPVQVIEPKKVVDVPLPPQKPAGMSGEGAAAVNQKPQKEEPATPEPKPALSEQIEPVPEPKSDEPVIDASIPLPPNKPQFDLPLPPSMMPPKADEKDEEGEEEGAGGGVEKQVDSVELACIEPAVMDIVKKAGAFFRAVPIITSGYRARGRRGSLHRMCKAVDFIVPGVSTQTLANYLKALPEAGGVGTYCHTKSVHIDVGEPRNWGYCGFRRTYFSLR
jgi:Peptidase M15